MQGQPSWRDSIAQVWSLVGSVHPVCSLVNASDSTCHPLGPFRGQEAESARPFSRNRSASLNQIGPSLLNQEVGRMKMTMQKLASAIHSVRGTGTVDQYRPWIEVTRKNSSLCSNVSVVPVPHLIRLTHYLSGAEREFALFIWWLGALDVSEQYPLWPWPHLEPSEVGFFRANPGDTRCLRRFPSEPSSDCSSSTAPSSAAPTWRASPASSPSRPSSPPQGAGAWDSKFFQFPADKAVSQALRT